MQLVDEEPACGGMETPLHVNLSTGSSGNQVSLGDQITFVHVNSQFKIREFSGKHMQMFSC